MKIGEIGELPLLESIRARFPRKSGSVLTGIGDDAAALKGSRKRLLATTDIMVEGVHFDLDLITSEQLGFKLVSVNVSDIYAMGGTPRFMLLSLAAPSSTQEAFVKGMYDGISTALKRYGVSLVGGDLSSAPSAIALSATILGYANRPVNRSGARPGDRLYITGFLGDSACGLRILNVINKKVNFARPLKGPLPWPVMEPLLRRHLMPEVKKPGAFLKSATSMIDVSDGLFLDLSRLCHESGVGAKLYAGKIPVSGQAKVAAESLGFDPLRVAVGGGEDYELLFTAGPRRKIRAIHIGEITASQGIFLVEDNGREVAVQPEGYRHFIGSGNGRKK